MAKKKAARKTQDRGEGARARFQAARAKAASEGAAFVWPKEELPFIREIHARLFDDDPRLVFADWLEERGDPRANFIRVQCQLARLRRRDPEYAELDRQSDEILAAHRLKWLKAYPDLPATTWGIDDRSWVDSRPRHHFHRGLATAVHPKGFNGFVRRMPLLVDELGMTEFDVAFESQEQVETFAALPQLRGVGALLAGTRSVMDLGPVLAAPQLENLWRLEVSSSRALGTLSRFLERAVSSKLRWLSLYEVDQVDDLRPLLDWEHPESLEVLRIRDPRRQWFELLASSRLRLSTWTELFESQHAHPAIQMARTASAPLLSEAARLSLVGLSRGSLGAISACGLPPKVTKLRIYGSFSNEELQAFLARVPRIEQLRDLSVYSNFLGDVGLRALAECGRLRNLRALSTGGLEITNAGAEALVQSLPGLEQLRIHPSTVTKETKKRLKKMFAGELVL